MGTFVNDGGMDDGIIGVTHNSHRNGVFGRNSSQTPRNAVDPGGNGIFGFTEVPDGSGVFGAHNTGGIGVAGLGHTGVIGVCTDAQIAPGGVGVLGASQTSDGVRGTSNGDNQSGVAGFTSSFTGFGVFGANSDFTAHGILGAHSGSSEHEPHGVFGANWNLRGYAGFFAGNVVVTGSLVKSGLFFRIDHPLDPANKFLYHASVESPDMKNLYDGVATLDGNGEAVVMLPHYVESLNNDFRYQLTALGNACPNLHIADEISNHRFKVAGGKPRGKVSWQVTGTRQDPYATKHPVQVEQEKGPHERGKYLHAEEYGMPETMGIGHEMKRRIIRELPPATLPQPVTVEQVKR